MKRDMDLIRLILLRVEEQDPNTSSYESITIDGYTSGEVREHIKLLANAGMISDVHHDLDGNVWVRSITWDGYDYLDKVRDNTIWKKTKDTIKEKGLPLIFDTIKTISSAFITAAAEGVGARRSAAKSATV